MNWESSPGARRHLRRAVTRIAWSMSMALAAPAASLRAATLVLDEPLHTSTSGTRSGGTFAAGGWQVTGQYDSIYWHIPTISNGAAEWNLRGLFPNESRGAMNDKTEIFHMYDYTFGNADVSYGGYRDNPYKHFVRKIGAGDGPPKTDALELVWLITPNYEEPDTPVLSWNPNTTYHFREEWGPDGGGNSVLRTYRDGTLLRTTTVPGTWSPAGHSVRIGAANPPGTRSAPLDAVYSNLKVWDLSLNEPPPPLPQPRTGQVTLNNHAFHDGQGDFVGLGASYFQALRRTKYDRARYRSDLDFLARQGFDYIRALSMVGGNSAWAGKEIAPITFQNNQGQTIQGWPDYWTQFRDMIDIAYDEYGIRTEITIFADAQNGMPNKTDRIAHMQGVLDNIEGREHKVILVEVANEAWQNGFPGAQGIADLREFGAYLGDRTDLLVALSSPQDTSNAGIQQLYQNSAADIATVHFTRDRSEDGWLPVRDPYRVNSIPGIPPVSSNEPVGPGSSVSSENSPIRLVSAAAYGWMSGLPTYVFHSNAGVMGNTNFQDMAGVSSYRHVADILPGDIANWQRTEGKDAFAPFITYANGQPNKWWTEVPSPTSGVVRHLSNVNGGEFYTLPIGILSGGVQLQARQDMTIQVFNPLTGEVVHEMTPGANQTFTLAQGPQAYIIRGAYADAGPARIDLARVNTPRGLVHPNTGDGDTVPVTIGGREARQNRDPASDYYMYFAAADWFTYQGEHPELFITVEYFDQGTGPLSLQYDSSAGSTIPAVYKGGGSIQRGDTGTWKTHVFHLTDAYFGNRQNYESDFRIFGGTNNTFYLDSVVVSTVLGSHWNVDASGDWAAIGNWAGGVPNGIDATVNFGSVITEGRLAFANAPITAGTINFTSPQTYVLSGLGTLTLEASTSEARVNVTQGTHQINLPLIIASDADLNVAAGATLLVSDPVTIAAGRTLSHGGAGSVIYQSTVTVAGGGAVSFAGGTARVEGLTLTDDARIDVSESLTVASGDSETMRAMLRQGFHGGDWRGDGISSTAAAHDPDRATALGLLDAGDAFVIRRTYYGDADIDGLVDLDDLERFVLGYDVDGVTAAWSAGDFDYNGLVDATDFDLYLHGLVHQRRSDWRTPELFDALHRFVGRAGLAVDLTPIPEPAAPLGASALAAAGVLRRRRRHQHRSVN